MYVTITSWPIIPLVWFEPSENVLIVPAAKEKTQIHFKEKTQICFQAAMLLKTMTLCGLCKYKVIHTEEVWDLFSQKKEILPTWMNSSKFLRWFRISVLYLIRNKLKGQTSRHYLGWNNSNGWTRNSLEDETNWNEFMSRATLQLWFWGLPL